MQQRGFSLAVMELLCCTATNQHPQAPEAGRIEGYSRYPPVQALPASAQSQQYPTGSDPTARQKLRLGGSVAVHETECPSLKLQTRPGLSMAREAVQSRAPAKENDRIDQTRGDWRQARGPGQPHQQQAAQGPPQVKADHRPRPDDDFNDR